MKKITLLCLFLSLVFNSLSQRVLVYVVDYEGKDCFLSIESAKPAFKLELADSLLSYCFLEKESQNNVLIKLKCGYDVVVDYTKKEGDTYFFYDFKVLTYSNRKKVYMKL